MLYQLIRKNSEKAADNLEHLSLLQYVKPHINLRKSSSVLSAADKAGRNALTIQLKPTRLL